ncbi:SKA complex subunit 2 isoform X1 [Salarias fasciatus]|uniref:SKA complex subunit 2 isoform X1 n=1 Tax=Salarias fasciatus TaxID=181472 RepID=UPI001176A695|nr:spindle and kinetochore-associated protein 2-like isoform X1 [Salarias fasciatus]
METAVEKLEAKFLKSDADLKYIEKRLKLDFINSTVENRSTSKANPVLMLDKLKVMKAKHSSLCSKVKEISAAQKESMNFITINFNHATEVVQNLQKTADVQIEPLTKSEQESAAILNSASGQMKAEVMRMSSTKNWETFDT